MVPEPSRISAGPVTSTESSAEHRLSMLAAAGTGLTGGEALQYALDQAVAELTGLAGMAHWCGPSGGRPLHLAVVSGLPRAAFQGWEEIGADAPSGAPTHAVRDGTFAWMPVVDAAGSLPDDTHDTAASRSVTLSLPTATMVAAVPIPGPDAPLGALSVLTASGEPTAGQRAFLPAVARWAAQRVPQSTTAGVSRRWWREQPAGSYPLIAQEPVVHALRYLRDGFLVVDGDWRTSYINVEAERLLGPAEDVLGRVLWDGPAGRVPGLEARCRQAAADGAPVGCDVQWPTDERWYHIRLVPVPNGLTLYVTDVTETKIRVAQRAAAERATAQRTAPIGKLTSALTYAVTARDVVEVVAEYVLPPFDAAGLVVEVFESGRRHVVGSVGYSPDFLRGITETPQAHSSPFNDVLRTRLPIFMGSPAEYIALYPGMAERAAASGKQAWAFLPLIASGDPIGCCAISFHEPHHFTGEERALLTALSGLVGQALARARLYDTEHARAQELQRGLLPRALPSTPAVVAAARYLPARSGIGIGGDWYDVIPLSADRVALVIGDVMGHGLTEAATMGRLRTAVHTLADLDLPPDEILAHLNDLVSDLGDDLYATCLYAIYDPTTGLCFLASAGHPPPAIALPDGTVFFADLPPDPPLGAAEPPFSTIQLHLPEDSLLVLYTDGLVESATRDIDSGMAAVARCLTVGPGAFRTGSSVGPSGDGRAPRPDPCDAREHLDRLCDALTTTLLPAQELTTDDAALLIARVQRLAPQNIASWPLPAEPVAAGLARRHVREQLTAWHLDDLLMTTELLASELVGNVVRHAKGPIQLRLLLSRTLICEVFDGSQATPRIRRAAETDEGGRGLQLVAAFSQHWGARYTIDGKCIWTEQPLPAQP
ncbi:SpoIIE family protein phosphatase [Streptomyces sp. 8N616]|uniref:SpoIIE family protein phosphatase n=1 Tax=Streptomyces sp. 8N616 TaxID=3457414 RepID=UPI003FD69430